MPPQKLRGREQKLQHLRGALGPGALAVVGAAILGLATSFTATFFGPSWSPAVSFGLLLFALAFRPAGLFGR